MAGERADEYVDSIIGLVAYLIIREQPQDYGIFTELFP